MLTKTSKRKKELKAQGITPYSQMTDDPFPELILNPHWLDVLRMTDGRRMCPSCGRKRMIYCYNCASFLGDLAEDMPKIELPVQIDIVKHKKELDSKSTAMHAKLISPNFVNIYMFPDIPDYDADKDVLIFPSDDALSVAEFAQRTLQTRSQPEGASSSPAVNTRRVVFVDCTWNQINPIINCSQLAGLPKIMLRSYKTLFWRPNGNKLGDECLSTIEAIYYFTREYHEQFHPDVPYTGQYDPLLLLFKFMYMKIKEFHANDV